MASTIVAFTPTDPHTYLPASYPSPPPPPAADDTPLKALYTLLLTYILIPLRVERERFQFDWLTPWHANIDDLRAFLDGTLECTNPQVDLYIRFRYGNGYRWSAVRGVKTALEEWEEGQMGQLQEDLDVWNGVQVAAMQDQNGGGGVANVGGIGLGGAPSIGGNDGIISTRSRKRRNRMYGLS
ncbi:hypothetical protein HDV00_007525 [Rhizophlyctis rosea]|nr:hypothetical protein HDV00_007525 [Rhizophlyctis rosea]